MPVLEVRSLGCDHWKKAAPAAVLSAYWAFALLYWESLLHLAVFDSFKSGFAYAVGFTVSAALLLALFMLTVGASAEDSLEESVAVLPVAGLQMSAGEIDGLR